MLTRTDAGREGREGRRRDLTRAGRDADAGLQQQPAPAAACSSRPAAAAYGSGPAGLQQLPAQAACSSRPAALQQQRAPAACLQQVLTVQFSSVSQFSQGHNSVSQSVQPRSQQCQSVSSAKVTTVSVSQFSKGLNSSVQFSQSVQQVWFIVLPAEKKFMYCLLN